MSDATFGTWTAAASPLTIEYSLVVIEEIRHEVAEGFQKLSRGGIEVGGLLYGVHEGQTLRIMAIRPIACEHASGPTFRLSEKDRAALHEQLRQNESDSRLDDLVCVGWYVSHTRTEIVLSESDQDIFSSFFTKPWQVTLVVRPSRGGNMRAGFFVWESGGTVNASQSYQEFSFPDRLATTFENRAARADQGGSFVDRSAPERNPVRASRPAPMTAAPPPRDFPAAARPRGSTPASPQAAAAPAAAASPLPTSASACSPAATSASAASATPSTAAAASVSAPQAAPSSNLTSIFAEAPSIKEPAPSLWEPADSGMAAKPNSGRKWLVLGAAIVIAGLAVMGSRYFTSGGTNDTIALSVLERDGQLDIEWNRQSASVARATGATLEIADGSQTRTIPLKPQDLSAGKFVYKRDSGDIQVRMILDEPDGSKMQEASRFLGPPPAKANDDELKTLQQRRDELEAEVNRLKQSNAQQADRIQQLERTLKILQTRQGN